MGWELRPYLVGLEAWFRNSGTPAGFKPKGPRIRSQTWCRERQLRNRYRSKAKSYGVDRVASALFGWIGGMVPKQRNPSRIQAQGASNSFADVVPNGSFETGNSKAKPMAWIECGMGASPYLVGLEAWFRNSGTPAGFKPKEPLIRSQTWLRNR